MKQEDFGLGLDNIEIVKVQRPLLASKTSREVLVYNENRTHIFQGEVAPNVIKAMKGKPKAYFYAKLPKKSGLIEISPRQAPEQDW